MTTYDRFEEAWAGYSTRMNDAGKPQTPDDKRAFLSGWLLGRTDLVKQRESDPIPA